MNLDFCPNKKSKEFLEMSGIFGEDKAYFLWMRNKGNHLEKAPNGADSKLFQDLLEYFEGNRAEALKAKARVYTNEFINWFGDWGGFKTAGVKDDLFTPSGEINWGYFELLLDLYHNNQPDSMFSHGRYTLATRPENHFTGEKNTLNHIKFVTQSMLNLLEGKYDVDLPFVSEARASMQNQKDLMIIAAMFHDAAKPYRHGDIHGWESADILRDLLGVDYNNRVAEWAVRHHMPMPFSHKAEFSLSNPEAIEVAKNIARDARRIGIDANTAINAFVLINAADVINGRELNVDDNWAKKAGEEGLKKYNEDISVKNVLSVELKEKVALLKKAFDEIKDEDFGDTAYNYSHQERFDYQAFPEGGREDKKLPYLNNTEYTGVSKVVDENGEPLVVWHGSKAVFDIFDPSKSDSRLYLSTTVRDVNFFSSDKTVADFFAVTEKQSMASAISRSISIVLDAYSGEEVPKDEIDDAIWTEAARRTGKSKEWCRNFWENEVPKEYKLHDEFGNSRMKDPNVKKYKYPVYLSIKSPTIINANGLRANEVLENNKQTIDSNDEIIINNIDETVGKQETATDYLVRNPNQIKHVENLGAFNPDDRNIYHNLRDEDGNYEDEVPPSYESYIDEESVKWFQRMYQLEHEFEELKRERIELNKQIKEANCDTISKLIVITKSGKIKFVEKPDRYVKIDNDTSIFGLVSTGILFKNDTISSSLLFPSKNVVRPDFNYYRTENSIRDNTTRIIYEALSVLKNHGKKVVYSPWEIVTSGIISEPENATVQILRMEKVLGIKLSDFVSSEETVVDDDTPYGKMKAHYYRIAFNIDSMLNRLPVLGHNLEIYDILNKVYEQKPVSKDNSLLIRGLRAKEKEIDEKLSLIQEEIRSLKENIRRKESDLAGLPFNKTLGSLIWLVKKYINDGLSKSKIDLFVKELNYENNSNIRINWKTKEVFGDTLHGKDSIDRTHDTNEKRIREIVKYLNDKFGNKIEVIIVEEDDWLKNGDLYDGSNSCIIGDTVYLRKSRMTTEIAAEEMLHTLVHGMKNGSGEFGNKQLFDALFRRAKENFPRLWDEIQRVYKYNHDEELVTLVLARYFNRDFDKRDTYKLEDLIDKFKLWFVKLFNSVIHEFAGTYYATVNDINPLLDFEDISDMLLAKNIKLEIQTITEIHKRGINNLLNHTITEDQILHSISSRQQAAQDEAQRIITRMNVLHKQYERIKSKTPSQQKIANKIFETLNELKQHRDISAIGIALKQAMLSLGLYDPTTNGPATGTSNDVYKYLFNKSQSNFSGVDAKQLVDMYRNTIKFYQDLINGIPSKYVIDLTDEDQADIAKLTDLIEQHIMPLWIQAMMKVGDDIVDEQISNEVEASDLDKEDMKQVAKDWLHKNLMYGDVSGIESYLYNASYSQDPIIKQAFHLIQYAEQLTLEEMHHIAPKLVKAYLKANKGLKSITPGWLSMMMEFDKDGKPTGNFLRELNYGQYQKDLKNFIERLNSDFIKKYKFTYITDETGAVVNSLTGEFAEDEEWGPNGEMPKYVEYQRAIEKFKKDRVFRRFTGNYYLERLSRPYDGTIDPMSPEFTDTKFHHGLSPKTLSRYSYYQSNINYYLDKCQDEKTGFTYPERLNPDDKLALDQWKTRLDDFTSIFNKDGSYKHGEDLKMAYEVRAWLKWIGLNTDSEHLQDIFNKEAVQVYQQSVALSNPKLYSDFIKYNASVGINPDFIAQTIGSLRSNSTDTDLSFRGRILRKALLDMVKSPNTYSRELLKMLNNPLFWLQCKASDQAIESARKPKQSGWDPDKVKAFEENFYDREILYVDANGFYSDENGNAVDPNSANAKLLEESGKLLTYRLYLINKYTNEAFTNGFVSGLIDESTGQLIDFSGMTVNDIRRQIITLLSYRYRVFDEDGNVEREEYRPLSIFSLLTPKVDTFKNKRTGKVEKTIVLLGEGRFKETNSSYATPISQFNPNEGIQEKPNASFDNGRYDNSEAFNKLTGDVKDLYDLLIQTMKDSLEIYSTNRKFNYKLPQINANDAALFSRLIKRGYTEKSLRAIWDSMTSIMPNDDRLRTKEDYFIGADGEIANDVPLKFIRSLKNPEDISTDLVSSVIMFADMAINYKNKTGIDATLKLLRYNMDPEHRKFYEDKLMSKSERPSEDNAGSRKMYDSMMDVLMYGNKLGDAKTGGPSKTKVAFHKTADAFLSLESSAMLGLNMFSMSVGFADSITRIFAESAAGKYMTIGDSLFALGKCLWYTPACIKNMFNPLANNKLTALMLMNGVSKGTFGIYSKTDWGKGRKLLGNILMGGWSMLDWMANALLMTAFYHNCRFYDGGVVPTGFYTKYELQLAFVNAGHTKHEANWVHHNWSNFGRRVTLWDAYYFKDGEAHVRPEFEQYVTQKIKTRLATKTKKRGALYNGMNPDNDTPRWKRDVIGRLAGALRGWIVQQWQHLVAGGTDNVVKTFSPELKQETTTSGTKSKTVWKKDKLTKEQRQRRFSWDYESGTPQDQIVVGLWRSIQTLFNNLKTGLLFKSSRIKLSETEKYAWKDALIFLAMLSMMMVGWTYVHDDARTVKAPTNREEAGPATWWNPGDYYDYMQNVYIPNQYWKLAVDDIYFRTVESKISNVNPQQVLDIVSALTALKSGLDDLLGVFGIASDAISGDLDSQEILKQGAYKFYTKGDRTLYRAIGPAKNLHTALTYYGATNNLRWYTNKFGKLYRAFGYDFKVKDKQSQSSVPTFSEGDFSGGDFVGGSFTGGNFE